MTDETPDITPAPTIFPLTPAQLAEFRKLEGEARQGIKQVEQNYQQAVGLMARGLMAGHPSAKITGYSDEPPGLVISPLGS